MRGTPARRSEADRHRSSQGRRPGTVRGSGGRADGEPSPWGGGVRRRERARPRGPSFLACLVPREGDEEIVAAGVAPSAREALGEVTAPDACPELLLDVATAAA